jgi:hypothetical protein
MKWSDSYEVSVQFFACIELEQSCMYMGCCKNSHVCLYNLLWVGVGSYKLMSGDLNRLSDLQ